MGMTSRLSDDEVRAWVERTCQAQGVPVKVTDRAVIATVVVLLGQSRHSGSTRSGSKRVRPRKAGRMVARAKTAATIEC